MLSFVANESIQERGVRPADVLSAIRHARGAGWQPEQSSALFRLGHSDVKQPSRNSTGTMSLSARPISHPSFPQWLSQSASEYAADLVRLGRDESEAQLEAHKTLTSAFPDGHPTDENAVFDLVDATMQNVGYIWVGRDHSDAPTAWWVWDIWVDPAHRGSGYGKAGMRLAEQYAASCGASSIGLNVFGFNEPHSPSTNHSGMRPPA